jgi:N-dimethylarginine dimethylaminohydrolase
MTQHVLLCEPKHFRIDYEINPWMRRANAVDWTRAQAQWQGLHRTLLDLGVRAELAEQRPEVPDMTFTANAGVVAGNRFIPANFRFRERQLEEPYFIAWFREHGYDIASIHEPHFWEGEGDVLPTPGEPALVFGGYRFRTEISALDHLESDLGTRIVPLELIDPRFYHLDTCLCPLGGGRALFVPSAFSTPSRLVLAGVFDDLVAVTEEDALRFACNAVVVGDRVVLNTECTSTERALLDRGLSPVATPTDEFLKAGGSVKCLVLQLDAFV